MMLCMPTPFIPPFNTCFIFMIQDSGNRLGVLTYLTLSHVSEYTSLSSVSCFPFDRLTFLI